MAQYGSMYVSDVLHIYVYDFMEHGAYLGFFANNFDPKAHFVNNFIFWRGVRFESGDKYY